MNKLSNILIKLGVLLIVVALLLTGYNVITAKKASNTAQDTLSKLTPAIEENFANLPEDEEYVPDYILTPEMDMPVERINGYGYIGTLKMETLGIELPVMEDWSYGKLELAVCCYSGTIYQHNMIIAGHNYQEFFGKIKNLAFDDEILFTDTRGNQFVYKVIDIEILTPYQLDELKSGDWDLTLFTCTVGARKRVVVRCELVDDIAIQN